MPMFDNAMHQIAALPTITSFTQPDVDLTLAADVSGGFGGPIASKEQRPLELIWLPLMAEGPAAGTPAVSTTSPRSTMRPAYALTLSEARGSVVSATGASEDLSSDLLDESTSVIDNTGTVDAVMTIADGGVTTGALTPAAPSVAKGDNLRTFVAQNNGGLVFGRAWRIYAYGART